MMIDNLKLLMPPPAEPLFAGSKKEWSAFQKKIGLKLPSDYFSVVNTYGSGHFLAGEFRVANPFDPDDEDFADLELATLSENKELSPKAIPYPLYPNAGGLYPFGIDGNGNTFVWVTAGDPDEWAIACFNPSQDYCEVVHLSLITFLVQLSTSKLKINRKKFWGNEASKEMLEFIPRQVRTHRKRKSQ